jgi:hypothetical protein
MKLTPLSKAIALILTSTALLAGCGSDGKDGALGTAGKYGAGQVIALEQTGRTLSSGFLVSASEIVAYDKKTNRIFSVNAQSGQVDIFNDLTATTPALHSSLNLAQLLVDNNVVRFCLCE